MFARLIVAGVCVLASSLGAAFASDTFQPSTPEELQRFYPSVPDAVNAALLYQQAQDARVQGKYGEDFPLLGDAQLTLPVTPFAPKVKEAIQEELTKNATTLQLLHRAAALRSCRFPIDMTKGEAIELPHLSVMRDFARLLALQAVNAADDGNPQLAAQSVLDIMAAAQSLRNEPLVISQISREAYWNISIHTLEQVVNRVQLDETAILQIREALGKADDPQAMTRAIQAELCMWMCRKTETLAQRKAREEALKEYWENHPPEPRVVVMDAPTPPVPDDSTQAPPPELQERKFTVEEKQAVLDELTRLIDESRLPHAEYAKRMPPPPSMGMQPPQSSEGQTPTKRKMLPAVPRAILGTVRLAAKAAAAQGAMAAERYRLKYGKSPEKWEDLVPEFVAAPIQDPFVKDTPLLVRPTETGCIVYSIGDNRIDDGGNSEGRPSRDYVFRIERPVTTAK